MDSADRFIKEPNLWSENPRFWNEEHAVVLYSCHEVEKPAKIKLARVSYFPLEVEYV